ncbi:hypothetical protein Tco_0704592 [Tanacetum coccineum]|uniref:Uncharacterized protein n=1 Tax=Tanacetum coccineum TaxID=301880 RepID=A0ABQ4Y305_9ASTR
MEVWRVMSPHFIILTTIVVVVLKSVDEGYTMNIIRVEYEWTPLRWSGCQNGASSSGTKKQAELTRQESSTSNPFDALNMVENDDDLGTNGGNSKLDEKGVNFDMVSSAYGTSSKAFGSQLPPL